MTSRQLIRRAKILEAVVDAIADVGHEAVQMRDVAQRSGVGLATAYRYFRSKEHLLAAALEAWQERLTRRIVSSSQRDDQDPLSGVLVYLHGAQRAFSRNREMTALMLQMMTSTDPDVVATIDRMNLTNAEMFERLLDGLPPEDIPSLSFALNAALTSAITRMLNGRMSLRGVANTRGVDCACLTREQLTANRSSMCGMTEFDGPSPASLSSATVMIFSPARARIAHSCASGSEG